MCRIRLATIEDAVRITSSLLSALHYAHERGIVHRDVKPGNILLKMNLADKLGEVHLRNVSLARMDSEVKTVLGRLIVTPWVMAPEQLRGEEVDRRIDIWAAGAIFYEMLTGERPFKESMLGIFRRIQTEEPLPPSALRPDLPRGFDGVIATALAKRPEHRFATALEMAGAIRAALEAGRPAPLPPLPNAEAPLTLPAPPLPNLAPRRSLGFPQGLLTGIALGGVLTALVLRLIAPSVEIHDQGGELALSLPPPPRVVGTAMQTYATVAAPVPAPEAEEQVMSSSTDPLQEMSASLYGADHGVGVNEAPAPPADPASIRIEADHREAMGTPSGGAASEAAGHTPAPPAEAAATSAPEGEGLRLDRLAAPTVQVATLPSSTDREVAAPAYAANRCTEEQLLMRSGNHDGFGRIVFEWRSPVTYRVQLTGRGAEIQFSGSACRPALEDLRLPRNVTRLFADGERDVLVLETARANAVSHHRWRGRLVLDVADNRE